MGGLEGRLGVLKLEMSLKRKEEDEVRGSSSIFGLNLINKFKIFSEFIGRERGLLQQRKN